jgi:hypothetical protein
MMATDTQPTTILTTTTSITTTNAASNTQTNNVVPILSRVDTSVQKKLNNISPLLFDMIENPTLDEATLSSAINGYTQKQKLQNDDDENGEDDETEKGDSKLLDSADDSIKRIRRDNTQQSGSIIESKDIASDEEPKNMSLTHALDNNIVLTSKNQ